MAQQSSELRKLLIDQLIVARQRDQATLTRNQTGSIIDVPGTGKILSSAYEQLRNAAEYAEEHLLLQRAIKRFLKRTLFFSKQRNPSLAADLIIELVQAGYLRGGQYSSETARAIEAVIDEYMDHYTHLRQGHVAREKAIDWIGALIAVEAENLLNPHARQQALVFLAYQHFLQAINRGQFIDLDGYKQYEICMYIAVHQSLIKSDIDIVRSELLNANKHTIKDSAHFTEFNKQIDELYVGELTSKLKRVISRSGAPFRILKGLLHDHADSLELLYDEQAFLKMYDLQISHEYKQVGRRLNRGLIKSIIFILITKVLIGVGLEVPYDLLVHGTVAIIPLMINLTFPPAYMASLKLGLKAPSAKNHQLVHKYMSDLLFGDRDVQLYTLQTQSQSSAAAKLLYTLLFAVPFVITLLLLKRFGFNILQMGIFFTFLSTASFLGFRLSTFIRELEMVGRQSGLLGSVRDFFYLPFIVSGQFISRKYAQVNLVGQFLDIAIELPLKAVLRLMRQWMRFLDEKHDELY